VGNLRRRGKGSPGRPPQFAPRPKEVTHGRLSRRSTTVLGALAAFCLAGAALAKLGEDDPVHASLGHGFTAWTWRGVVVAAVIAVGLALLACLAFASALLRPGGRDGTDHPTRALPMTALAIASLLALPTAAVGYAHLFRGHGTRSGAQEWLPVIGMCAIVGILLAVALIAGTTAIRRLEVPATQARLAAQETIAAPVAMALCTAAAVSGVWRCGLRPRPPSPVPTASPLPASPRAGPSSSLP